MSPKRRYMHRESVLASPFSMHVYHRRRQSPSKITCLTRQMRWTCRLRRTCKTSGKRPKRKRRWLIFLMTLTTITSCYANSVRVTPTAGHLTAHPYARSAVDRKNTSDTMDLTEMGRHFIQIDRLRAKNKRKVDTRASKGVYAVLTYSCHETYCAWYM